MKAPYITGFDQSGVPLIGGIYTLKDEIGFPVDASFDWCCSNGCAIDWVDFLSDVGRQTDWKWDSAVEEMGYLLGEYLTKQIVDKYKLYFSFSMNDVDEPNWISVNEYILDRKQKGAKIIAKTANKIQEKLNNELLQSTGQN